MSTKLIMENWRKYLAERNDDYENMKDTLRTVQQVDKAEEEDGSEDTTVTPEEVAAKKKERLRAEKEKAEEDEFEKQKGEKGEEPDEEEKEKEKEVPEDVRNIVDKLQSTGLDNYIKKIDKPAELYHLEKEILNMALDSDSPISLKHIGQVVALLGKEISQKKTDLQKQKKAAE